MVGPISDADRSAFARRLQVAIVLVVGASGGLSAIEGGASTGGVALATVAGLVVGVILVWLVFPSGGGRTPRGR